MNITIRQGEELAKIFVDNKYVGYLDEKGDLYCFDKINGYAQFVKGGVEYSRATIEFRNHVSPVKPKKKRRCGKEEIKIIRSLTAIVAVTQPQSPALERALKYLEEVGK